MKSKQYLDSIIKGSKLYKKIPKVIFARLDYKFDDYFDYFVQPHLYPTDKVGLFDLNSVNKPVIYAMYEIYHNYNTNQDEIGLNGVSFSEVCILQNILSSSVACPKKEYGMLKYGFISKRGLI